MVQKKQTHQDGVTLLITLLTIGVLLAVGVSMLNITLKQYQLSGIELASEMAFQAATAGTECMKYHNSIKVGTPPLKTVFQFEYDGTNLPTLPSPLDIDCFGGSVGVDPDTSEFESKRRVTYTYTFDSGVNPGLCTKVSIHKFYPKLGEPVDTVLPNGEKIKVDRNGDGETNDSDRCGVAGGDVCTVIESRGYSVPCDNITTPRVVEREYTMAF